MTPVDGIGACTSCSGQFVAGGEWTFREIKMVTLRIDESMMAELGRSNAANTPVRALAKERYSAIAPRFWHGMTFGQWVRLIARNRFDFSLSRMPTVAAWCS